MRISRPIICGPERKKKEREKPRIIFTNRIVPSSFWPICNISIDSLLGQSNSIEKEKTDKHP